MPATKRIAFFGTPSFTVSFLEALQKEGLTPSLVITNPDRPAGRGMSLAIPAPKAWALERHITVLQPEQLNETFFETLSKDTWDLFIVVAYGKIIPEKIINLPTFGTINVHYSLLPRYRGATPVESAILSGDTSTGVAIQKMQFKLDTGPILTQKEIAMSPSDTTPVLRERLNEQALEILPGLIKNMFDGNTRLTPQDDTLATHCTKITKEDGEISLSDDPSMLDRKWRAYQPWPGLYFYVEKNDNRVRVKIKEAHLSDGNFIIDTVIPENGKPLSWDEFERWKNS